MIYLVTDKVSKLHISDSVYTKIIKCIYTKNTKFLQTMYDGLVIQETPSPKL